MIVAAFFFAGGFIVSLVVTLGMLQFEWPFGYDKPDAFRKKHLEPTLRLGGIPLVLVFVTALLVQMGINADSADTWVSILFCCALIFIIGIVDDIRPLPATVKLVGQIGVALLAFGFGLAIEKFSYPAILGMTVELGSLSIILTVLWLIAIPNIINLIDGIDGLASGLGMFLFFTLGYVGWVSSQSDVLWVSFAMSGALLGFLMFNFPPARIFLGDGGAYLIGFCIAIVSLQSSNKGSIAAALLVTLVALGLPILDTGLAMIRRWFRGVPIFRADAEHIHHKLQRMGLSKIRAVLGMYLVCVILSLTGLSVFWSQGRTLPIAGAVVFILALFALKYLGYIWSWSTLSTQIWRSLGRRGEMRFAVMMGQVMEMEVERCESLEEFIETFDHALRRVGLSRVATPEAKDESLKDRTFFLKISLGEEIELHSRCDDMDVEHWKRIGDCFRSSYSRALEKWTNLDE